MRRSAILVLALAALGAHAARAVLPDACRSTVDDPPPANGPANHKVGHAVSSDGLVFADSGAPALPKASVPDAVERPGGETLVYYVSGEAGRHGIHVGRLSASGEIVPFDCVRLDGAYDGHAVDPDVVLLADGRIRLFYRADFGLDNPPGTPAIQSAVSSDGVHFTIEGIALETAGGADPSVTRLADGSWLMATPGRQIVFLASSDDGLHFTPMGSVPIDGIPELWSTGEQVHLLAGSDQLRNLVSSDGGVTWSQGPALTVNLPAESGFGSPSISGHPGAWRLFVIELGPPPGGGGGPGGGPRCQPGETTLCLGDGRFRVTAGWRVGPGSQGSAHAHALGRDSGYFWFFGPDNAEVLVKVLDGCAVNDAFWAFAAGLTTLEVELRVEDLLGGTSWVHRGAGGANFPSRTDIEAFHTCDAGPP
jgi:hypothetical protein